MHCTLYNAALANRRDAWRMRKKNIFFRNQSKELTLVRADDPAWSGQHRRLAVGTLRRVDRAFQAFFRRVRNGEAPGFPRFKPLSRFRTLEVDGVEPGMLRYNLDRGKVFLHLKGLPRLEMRTKGRPIPPKEDLTTIRVTRTGRRCTVSLGYRVEKGCCPRPDGPSALTCGRASPA